MEQQEIIRFLNYPDKGLVEYALSCANLTAHERQTIEQRVYCSMTIEEAAEALFVSPGTIKNRSSSGYEKLDSCWSGKAWIGTLLKQ